MSLFIIYIQILAYLKFRYCVIITGNTLMFISSPQAVTLFPNAKIQADVSRSDFISSPEQENIIDRTSWNRNEILELIDLYGISPTNIYLKARQ